MLRRLRLRDFVIVEAAEIGFADGFSVLTGETGAGKSILLDALGLALGARGDAAMIREGAPRADITAEFSIDAATEAWLNEHDLAGDPGTLLLRRIVEADGRSRARINDHPATIAVLRDLGERLVDIHGQHESQSLLRAGAQRALLDRHGRHEADVTAVAAAWTEWQQLVTSLERARTGSREDALRLERLTWEIDEIARLRLIPGEWEALSHEQHRLAHGRDLLEGCDAIAEALARGDGALTESLATLQQRLRALAQLDPSLTATADLVDTAAIQLDEAAADLASYAQRMDLDPERLADVEQRVSAIFSAARKLRLQPEELIGHLTALQDEAAQLARQADIGELEKATAAAETHYRTVAAALTQRRQKTARTLASGVSEQIGRLGMAGAQLIIACEPTAPGPGGVDAVEFRIASHAGATARPIARVASGGELSRIGLAITVLAAAANPVPTLIFDEADAGIGGAVAAVVGELMQRLATDCQVFCVTHLPQVASRADHHLRVSKSSGKQGPGSRVDMLDDAQRVDEIARMLGGKDLTGATRAHAEEMLTLSARGSTAAAASNKSATAAGSAARADSAAPAVSAAPARPRARKAAATVADSAGTVPAVSKPGGRRRRDG